MPTARDFYVRRTLKPALICSTARVSSGRKVLIALDFEDLPVFVTMFIAAMILPFESINGTAMPQMPPSNSPLTHDQPFLLSSAMIFLRRTGFDYRFLSKWF